MKGFCVSLAGLSSVAAAMVMPSDAGAQILCSPAASRDRLAASELAIAQWQARNSVSLSAGAKAMLETDLCRAVSEISSQTGAPIKDVDAAAGPPITAYLDDTLSDRSQFPGLSARFEMAFLLNASARLPEQRRAAIVTFQFTRTVDQIAIGATRRPPARRLVSEYGTFPYQGFRSRQRVCGGTFVVNSSLGAIARC